MSNTCNIISKYFVCITYVCMYLNFSSDYETIIITINSIELKITLLLDVCTVENIEKIIQFRE